MRDAAGVGGLEAADDPQQRRLAAAAGAEQGDERPRLDPQRHVVEGGRRAEALDDPLDDDGGVARLGGGAAYAARTRSHASSHPL